MSFNLSRNCFASSACFAALVFVVMPLVARAQQNGQVGAQGEQQNGQSGYQGEQQNGQFGAQGEQQNGQQGQQNNGQAAAINRQQKVLAGKAAQKLNIPPAQIGQGFLGQAVNMPAVANARKPLRARR